MEATIKETTTSKYGTHAHVACGKVEAAVSVMTHGLQVCCMNASNRVWRGAGRFFPSVEAAMENYKSAEMKAIIQAAVASAFVPSETNFAA